MGENLIIQMHFQHVFLYQDILSQDYYTFYMKRLAHNYSGTSL